MRATFVLAGVVLVLVAATAEGLPIHDVQGSGLISPHAWTTVTTQGVVTVVDSRGFWIQDPVGDGDPTTSDGVFVFTSAAPDVAIGDAVSVSGRVVEYAVPWVETPGFLTMTEIAAAWPTPLAVDVLSHGNPLPRPEVIGAAGRLPPTTLVRPDGRAFWESLEGMLVTLADAQAVGPRRSTGEIAVVVDRGVGATGMNSRGGLTLTEGDENPEWVLVRRDPGVANVTVPFANVGDLLGDATGVVGYGSGGFEVLLTAPVTHVDSGLDRAVATVPSSPDRLRIASCNVHNLSPNTSASRFAALAWQIVVGLGSPQVVALQEIQDDDGAPSGSLTDDEARAVSSVVSAAETYRRLIEAIVAAGGPLYQVTQVDPEDDHDGGVPGGNIRVAFLHDPVRVSLLGESERLPGSEDSPGPFDDARKPLVATFSFRGQDFTVVNAHFSSRYGSVPLYGVGEPTDAGQDEREAQAAFVNDWADGLLAEDPGASLVVLGDLNEFPFGSPLSILTGQMAGDPILFDAAAAIDPRDRYSYLYGGNSQQLDHVLLGASLMAGARPVMEFVHLNALFRTGASDHDPVIVSLWVVPEPGTAALMALGALAMLRCRRANARSRAPRIVREAGRGVSSGHGSGTVAPQQPPARRGVEAHRGRG